MLHSTAIIFDCDGVLVDTEGLKKSCMGRMLANLGIPFTDQDHLEMVGRSAEDILKLINSKHNTNYDLSIYHTFDRYYAEMRIHGVAKIARNVTLARMLANEGASLGLASSDTHVNINSNLQLAGVEDIFQVRISGMDDLPLGFNKPHPRIYETAMTRLGVSPERSIVIEDTAAGAEAGNRAGAKVIALPNAHTRLLDFTPWAEQRWEMEAEIASIFEGVRELARA